MHNAPAAHRAYTSYQTRSFSQSLIDRRSIRLKDDRRRVRANYVSRRPTAASPVIFTLQYVTFFFAPSRLRPATGQHERKGGQMRRTLEVYTGHSHGFFCGETGTAVRPAPRRRKVERLRRLRGWFAYRGGEGYTTVISTFFYLLNLRRLVAWWPRCCPSCESLAELGVKKLIVVIRNRVGAWKSINFIDPPFVGTKVRLKRVGLIRTISNGEIGVLLNFILKSVSNLTDIFSNSL